MCHSQNHPGLVLQSRKQKLKPASKKSQGGCGLSIGWDDPASAVFHRGHHEELDAQCSGPDDGGHAAVVHKEIDRVVVALKTNSDWVFN